MNQRVGKMLTDTPTLEDVARLANVSTATISRSINSPDKVAKSTHEKIQSAIEALGYTPNHGGKVLASSRSNTVGAVIPTMANAMFASGLQAFQETLSEAGISLLVASSGYNSDDEFRQIRTLMSHGADGLLLIGASRPSQTTDFLKLRNIPYVMSWCYENDPERFFAGFDNSEASLHMTNAVLDYGHRRISMIAGRAIGNDRAASRIDGVKRAISRFGSQATLVNVIETDYTLENGMAAFEQLMSAREKPTAVICGNDVLAAGAINSAKLLGLSVPGTVSITGFDDINLATAVDPSLTTARVPQLAMGRSAATLLLEVLAGNKQPTSIKFDTEIVMRESLGPVPG